MKYEPRGVCLLFGAWNVPFTLFFTPLIPMIIDETADIKTVAQNICMTKTYNNGQVCGSANYVFVPAARRSALVEEVSNSTWRTSMKTVFFSKTVWARW